MHFYMHSYVDKNFILVKSGCYKGRVVTYRPKARQVALEWLAPYTETRALMVRHS
jgi:hypothetical protein